MSSARIQVRPAVQRDLPAILDLERATESVPHWPEATYAAAFAAHAEASEPRRCLFVALRGDALVGFAVGMLAPAAELESIAVAAHLRRAGVGRALCLAVLDGCRAGGAAEVILEVRATSEGAVALYAQLGFIQTGLRRRYYREPEDDALLMRLDLSQPLAAIPAS